MSYMLLIGSPLRLIPLSHNCIPKSLKPNLSHSVDTKSASNRFYAESGESNHFMGVVIEMVQGSTNRIQIPDGKKPQLRGFSLLTKFHLFYRSD